MMGERFHSWELLDEVHPPLHPGCPCALWGAAEAIGRGLMTSADPEFGVHEFRMLAHEAAHSLSGVQPGPLPGISQTVEEGAAEVLSLWFWKHRGQDMDERDAVPRHGSLNAARHRNAGLLIRLSR